MSGIAAVFNKSKSPVQESLIAQMASIMAERGPHKQHYWYDGHIALAHCLLVSSFEAIREHQPSNIARKYWITADARLDAREQLISKLNVHHPELTTSTTDDQLILHAYASWGVDCLEHLIGDFAFIIWDSEKHQLFCATDHFGVTPLYYSETKNSTCVSNSINTLRIHSDVSSDLNDLAVADYLITRTNENPCSTIFRDIKRLPGGHYLLIGSEKTNLRCYWSPKPRGDLHQAGDDTYIEEFSELLTLAVEDRVRSLGVGTHLSGGMDSTTVTALANRYTKNQSTQTRIKAYTSAASGKNIDLEMPFATEVAKAINIDHQIMKNEENAFSYEPPNVQSMFPEPYNLGSNSKPHKILKDIQSFGSVLLTGFGGDPLLRGEPMRLSDIRSPIKFGFIAKQAISHYRIFSERPYIGSSRKVKMALNPGTIKAPYYLNGNFSRELGLSERLYSRASHRASSRNSQSGMVDEGLWRRIFCWNDPGFTNIPVKVRHPFFDKRLFEYAQTLPRFPWLNKKHILRESMRNLLPNSIIERPKTALLGFRALDTLKEKGVPSHFYELLSSPQLTDYVDTISLEKRLNNIDECNHFDIRGILNSLGLAHWLLEYKNTPSYLKSTKGDKNATRIY